MKAPTVCARNMTVAILRRVFQEGLKDAASSDLGELAWSRAIDEAKHCTLPYGSLRPLCHWRKRCGPGERVLVSCNRRIVLHLRQLRAARVSVLSSELLRAEIRETPRAAARILPPRAAGMVHERPSRYKGKSLGKLCSWIVILRDATKMPVVGYVRVSSGFASRMTIGSCESCFCAAVRFEKDLPGERAKRALMPGGCQ